MNDFLPSLIVASSLMLSTGNADKVTKVNDLGPGSLRDVVESAASGDVITFHPNLNGETITLNGSEIVLTKDLVIDGSALADGFITISGNNASRIFTVEPNQTVTLCGLYLADGLESNGGGIFSNGNLTMQRCQIESCNANESGGGIYIENGTVTLDRTSISGNTALRRGGGIYIDDGLASFNQSAILGNRSNENGSGGGVYVSNGSGIFSQSTISGNYAGDTGGGVYVSNGSAAVTFSRSTVSENYGDDGGGGVMVSHGSATFNQSTVSGNFTSENGGGVLVDEGSVIINQSTIADNTAEDSGGGIAISTGTLMLIGSIVAGNAGGNIKGTVETMILSLTSGDPKLAPLGNYGGLTQTMPPLIGSPAIDGGDKSGFAMDQRGAPRLSGDKDDIGAVEYLLPYGNWVAVSGLTFGENDGYTDDPNQDGKTNILHFADNTDPLGNQGGASKNRIGINLVDEEQSFTLTMPVRVGAKFSGSPILVSNVVDGISYHIEGDDDLAAPFDFKVVEANSVLNSGLPPLRDIDGDGIADWEYRTFMLLRPLSVHRKGFVRVEVRVHE